MHFRTSSISHDEIYQGHHRFEHWYRDNTVYFITARTKEGIKAFAREQAKEIFWNRFDHYTHEYGFDRWITSLIDNHYHAIGFIKIGENLGSMMQRIHGSVAKLVNDTLDVRLKPFWFDSGKQGYFDGCLRDTLQLSRAYRYVLLQSVRHGIVRDFREYAHTRVELELDDAIGIAVTRNGLMEGVPYARYEKRRSRRKS